MYGSSGVSDSEPGLKSGRILRIDPGVYCRRKGVLWKVASQDDLIINS